MMEQEAIRLAEEAFAEAQRLGGPHVRCGPGCSQCCHRAFPITAADARRLQQGLAEVDPALAKAIQTRAALLIRQWDLYFPGDLSTGAITGNAEWQEWFFNRTEGSACPALDPSNGQCLLYAWRPVACRAAGPLVQLGDAVYPPCPLNYQGVGDLEREALTARRDAPCFHEAATEPETIVAFALCDALS
jgi:Fe-S-cluster containining protein